MRRGRTTREVITRLILAGSQLGKMLEIRSKPIETKFGRLSRTRTLYLHAFTLKEGVVAE